MPDMYHEIELKLAVPADAVAALRRHALLADGPARSEQLVSSYFDTADRRLREAGVSLRIRHKGTRRIQTVKADSTGHAGLFARPEWEQEINADLPDLALLAGTPVAALIADGAALAPCFEVRVERSFWRIVRDGGEVEIVLDEGEILADGRALPLCELELELKHGPSTELFALARALAADVPLRLEVRSKSARGYELLDDAPQRAVKASAVPVARGMTAAEGFRTIVHACLVHFRANEARAAIARDPAALHQARVAIRRLRSAFSLFRHIIADAQVEPLRDELRWIAGVLGDARNLDVLLSEDGPLAGAGDPALRVRLETDRSAAYHRAADALASPRCCLLMIDLVAWAEIGSWLAGDAAGRRLRKVAAKVLDTRWRRVIRRGRNLAAQGDEGRHAVRIEVKKLRYAAEFFAPLWRKDKRRKRHKAFTAALVALQESLGALNDVATAEMLVVKLAGGGAGFAAAPDPARIAQLLTEAEQAHAAVVEAKPFWR